jgi:hypothetical protein
MKERCRHLSPKGASTDTCVSSDAVRDAALHVGQFPRAG